MGVPAPPGLLGSGLGPYWPNDQANFVVQGTVASVGPTPAGVFYGPFNISVWASVTLELTTAAGSLDAEVDSATNIDIGSAIVSDLVPFGSTVSSKDTPNPDDITIALPTYTLTGNVKVGQSTISGLVSTDWLLGAEVSGPGITAGSVVTSVDVEADQTADPPIYGTVTIDQAVVAPSNPRFNLAQRLPFEFALSADAIGTGVDAGAQFNGGVTNGGVIFTALFNVVRSFDGGLSWVPVPDPYATGLDVLQLDATRSVSLSEPEKGVLYRLDCAAYSDTGVTVNYRMSATGQAATSLAVPV